MIIVRTLLVAFAGFTLAACSASVGNADAAPGSDALVCPGGYVITSCGDGVISMNCCPSGAHCAPVPGFCDLGGGACSTGTACPRDGGSD